MRVLFPCDVDAFRESPVVPVTEAAPGKLTLKAWTRPFGTAFTLADKACLRLLTSELSSELSEDAEQYEAR